MRKFDLKKVIEWLGFVLKCPICGQKYHINQTRIIDSEQDDFAGQARLLIHSDCGRCKSSVMFNIDVRGPEVFSVSMVTDLTSADTSKFKNHNPISIDEVIGIHQGIRNFDGDFIRTIAKK